MNSGLFDEEAYRDEAARHNEFLNSVLGLLAFTLALTCLGFEHPDRAALLCLGIIAPIYWQAFRRFPPTLYALRALAKEAPDEGEVKEAVKYLEKKYHGFSALFKNNLVLIIGLTFYGVVLLHPEALIWFKT